MKAIHLADLHIGKTVNGFSMLEDQREIMRRILHITDREKPDCVLIAGDVYDKPVPSADAVALFDEFLVQLAERVPHTFVISGNHDSPERIAFGGRLMNRSGIHMAPVYDGRVTAVTITDAHGPVYVYMLPFIKPVHVRRFYPDEPVESYTDAVRAAIAQMHINPAHRNVLITHQFVTGALRSESEECSVGGTDDVDVSVFADFDYVALGHLHRAQRVGSDFVRYAGSPLSYSFSEARYPKSVPVVELGEKSVRTVKLVPLLPPHEMVELRGRYMELMDRAFYADTDYATDYVHITLTDEADIPDAVGRLRTVYRNLMRLDYDNCRTRGSRTLPDTADRPSPMQLFADFYEAQNNQPMTDAQRARIEALIAQIWGGAE